MIVRENINDFALEHIFECGQCFRWEKEQNGSYTGIVAGRKPVNITFTPYEGKLYSGQLIIDNAEDSDYEDFWKEYLDLNRDYGKIKAELSKNDKVMAKAIDFGQGIRILRQDVWETLVSFIISQNNNIKRIKKCIRLLCENFGEFALEYRGEKFFETPTAKVLASLSEKDLEVCGLGYRAKYLIETAKAIEKDNGKSLIELKKADTSLAFAYLTSLHGVGPKVANCILLFALARFESFPIDVWVKEAMNKLYGIDKENKKAMAEYAEKNFGEFGGVAQQYLFYYSRSRA